MCSGLVEDCTGSQQIHISTSILLERLISLCAGIFPLLVHSIYFVYCLNSHSLSKYEQAAQLGVV